jgi:hypothetical protein
VSPETEALRDEIKKLRFALRALLKFAEALCETYNLANNYRSMEKAREVLGVALVKGN